MRRDLKPIRLTGQASAPTLGFVERKGGQVRVDGAAATVLARLIAESGSEADVVDSVLADGWSNGALYFADPFQ